MKAQSKAAIAERLSRPGAVIFEGAQGVLLDKWRGFHPHTSWSTINTDAVEHVLTALGISAKVEHYGVMRSYLTRHGAGPLPTHDAALNGLTDPHNSAASWQGEFRRGHPDAVLLRYALDCVGKLAGLLVSHLDVFDRIAGLRWCGAYAHAERLEVSATHDLAHQSRLTASLNQVEPVYDAVPLTCADDLLRRIEATSVLPIMGTSHGNTHVSVRTHIRH